MGLGRPGSKGPGPGVGSGSGSGGGRRGSSGSSGGTPGRGGLGSGSSGPPGSRCSCTDVSVVPPLRRGSFKSAMISTLILSRLSWRRNRLAGISDFSFFSTLKPYVCRPLVSIRLPPAARWAVHLAGLDQFLPTRPYPSHGVFVPAESVSRLVPTISGCGADRSGAFARKFLSERSRNIWYAVSQVG
jgi:hypothetical protein